MFQLWADNRVDGIFCDCGFDFGQFEKAFCLQSEIVVEERDRERKLGVESRLNREIQIVGVRLPTLGCLNTPRWEVEMCTMAFKSRK